MKILIVEDEPRAASRLERMIKAQLPKVEIVEKIPSVRAAIEWFSNHPEPDLIFLDVRLEDGDSFEILAQVNIQAPIIFCTAYSEYALEAFQVNSIDYLLKPVSDKKLAHALAKYERFSGFRMREGAWANLSLGEKVDEPKYRKRFMIPQTQHFEMIDTANIVALLAYLKGTELTDIDGKTWILDDPLINLEADLNPDIFMRVSRQAIVQLSYVETLTKLESGYGVCVTGIERIIPVSRANLKSVKAGLDN